MEFTSRGQQIVAAIQDGLLAGADNADWDAPEMEAARSLTDSEDPDMLCAWDFAGWRDAERCISEHGKLGGVVLGFALTYEMESDGRTRVTADDFPVLTALGDDDTSAVATLIREYFANHDDDDVMDESILIALFTAYRDRGPSEDERAALWSHLCSFSV